MIAYLQMIFLRSCCSILWWKTGNSQLVVVIPYSHIIARLLHLLQKLNFEVIMYIYIISYIIESIHSFFIALSIKVAVQHINLC